MLFNVVPGFFSAPLQLAEVQTSTVAKAASIRCRQAFGDMKQVKPFGSCSSPRCTLLPHSVACVAWKRVARGLDSVRDRPAERRVSNGDPLSLSSYTFNRFGHFSSYQQRLSTACAHSLSPRLLPRLLASAQLACVGLERFSRRPLSPFARLCCTIRAQSCVE